MKDFTAQNQDSILSSSHDLMKKVINQPEYYKIFANWIVLNYEPTKCNLMDAEAVFVGMVQNYFTREKAYWQDTLQTKVIQQRAAEMSQSLLGKKAPNVISKDQTGGRQELYSKTADYVVVYLYNPDCEHCQEQTPKLYKLYKEKSGEIDVFAIAIETDDKKWKDYIAKNNLTWTNVYDPTNKSIYGKYWVDITPEIYVMNKEKILIGKNLKVDQIQTVINSDKKKRGLATN
jgi:peroxiredoxin